MSHDVPHHSARTTCLLKNNVIHKYLKSLFIGFPCSSFTQVNKDLQTHREEIINLGNELGVDITTINFESWTTDVREHATRNSDFNLTFTSLLTAFRSSSI